MTVHRPSKIHTFMRVAAAISEQSTCHRRRVGCVLMTGDYEILSMGYNGVPAGMPHCIDPSTRCDAAMSESGTDIDGCLAIHAEINALIRCPDVRKIYHALCTTSPCVNCVKALMGTSCQHIHFIHPYPDIDHAQAMWERSSLERKISHVVGVVVPHDYF